MEVFVSPKFQFQDDVLPEDKSVNVVAYPSQTVSEVNSTIKHYSSSHVAKES